MEVIMEVPDGWDKDISNQELVRCKDCIFGRPAKDESGSDAVRCFSDVHPLDWFCADCVRKTS